MKECRFKQRSNDLRIKKEKKKFDCSRKNLQWEEVTIGRTYRQKKKENKN